MMEIFIAEIRRNESVLIENLVLNKLETIDIRLSADAHSNSGDHRFRISDFYLPWRRYSVTENLQCRVRYNDGSAVNLIQNPGQESNNSDIKQ